MDSTPYDPDACYGIDAFDKVTKRTTTIAGLTLDEVNEFKANMTPDSIFEFFRVFPDGTKEFLNL